MKEKLAEPRPGSHLSRYPFQVSTDLTFRLKIKDPNQGLLLLRFYATKFYARGEKLEYNEKILLELVLEYFRDLRNRPLGKQIMENQSYLALFGLFRLWATFRDSEYPKWAKTQVAILIKSSKLLTPRAFLGVVEKMKVERFVKRFDRRLAKEPPPERRIGVGYRDKGTAAIPSLDGSPHWTELAVQHNLSSEPFGAEAKRSLERETPFRLLQPLRIALAGTG